MGLKSWSFALQHKNTMQYGSKSGKESYKSRCLWTILYYRVSHKTCPTLFFYIFLSKEISKNKIWWYHQIPCWILCMKMYKNLFLAGKVISIFPRGLKNPKNTSHPPWKPCLGEKGTIHLFSQLKQWLRTFFSSKFNEELDGAIKFCLRMS